MISNEMKKIVIYCVFAILLSVSINAQDTLNGPKNNYFFTEWYGGNYMPYDTVIGHTGFVLNSGLFGGAREFFKYMSTDTVIRIYGIAAALFSECVPPNGAVHTPLDSSLVNDLSTTNVFEYLRLYTYIKDSNTWEVINEKRVHYTEDTFDHYFYIGGVCCYPPYQRVYEAYFDTASNVVGPFGVGISQVNSRFENGKFSTWPMGVYIVQNLVGYDMDAMSTDTIYLLDSYAYSGWKLGTHLGYLYIFPILDHNCHVRDTSGDVSGIQSAADLGTAVYPNPAKNQVQVLSAVGLERVEVYNSTGVRVFERRAEGNSMTIDVSRWPAGTYLLTIRTTLGSATRRLTVVQ